MPVLVKQLLSMSNPLPVLTTWMFRRNLSGQDRLFAVHPTKQPSHQMQLILQSLSLLKIQYYRLETSNERRSSMTWSVQSRTSASANLTILQLKIQSYSPTQHDTQVRLTDTCVSVADEPTGFPDSLSEEGDQQNGRTRSGTWRVVGLPHEPEGSQSFAVVPESVSHRRGTGKPSVEDVSSLSPPPKRCRSKQRDHHDVNVDKSTGRRMASHADADQRLQTPKRHVLRKSHSSARRQSRRISSRPAMSSNAQEKGITKLGGEFMINSRDYMTPKGRRPRGG